MSKPLYASIIISSFNYGAFLRQAVESALNQTYPHTQVIVVDDGSTDDSPEIIASYGQQITSILKANGGQASVLNAGFAVSSGDIIVFLDSDDVLLPTAIENVLTEWRTGEFVKAHWPLWEIDSRGQRTGAIVPSTILSEGELYETLIRYGPGSYSWPPTSGNAWSRKFIQTIMPLPEEQFKTCPDAYLSTLAPLFGTVKRISEPQAAYRVHGRNNMNGISYGERFKRYHMCLNALKGYAHDQGKDIQPDLKQNQYYTWLERVFLTTEDLERVIRSKGTFILVDDEQLRMQLSRGRQALPFIERGGHYWGHPADDETAIRELERLRGAGASHMVFRWPSFWWLDCYSSFHHYLRSRFRCVLRNDRLIIFDLER